MWKELLIKMFITFPTIQMFRFFTALHKVWATEMSFNINSLKNHGTITGTYLPFAFSQGKSGDKAPSFFRKNRPSGIKKFLFIQIIAAFFLTLNPSGAFSETMAVSELTAKIQDAYEGIADLKADFIQEMTIKSAKKTEREAGIVWIKTPGMMYWDYKKPKVKKLVLNAKKSWLYVDEDKTVYIQSADAAYRSKLAVKFLSGMGKLSADFTIEFSTNGHTDAQGNYILNLTARQQGSIPDKIDVTVDKNTFHIVMCRFKDDYGNTTHLGFSHIKINTGVADSFFTFKPAADVEIVNVH